MQKMFYNKIWNRFEQLVISDGPQSLLLLLYYNHNSSLSLAMVAKKLFTNSHFSENNLHELRTKYAYILFSPKLYKTENKLGIADNWWKWSIH